MAPIRIAVIGVGKIARDEHLPSIGRDPRFELAALVSGSGATAPGVPTFRDAAELHAALPDLDAVAICTPPSARPELVRRAIDAGADVLMEKPPTPTVGELRDLASHAEAAGRVLFTTWQFAVQCRRGGPPRAARRSEAEAPRHHLEGGRATLAPEPGQDLGSGGLRRLRPPASTPCRS